MRRRFLFLALITAVILGFGGVARATGPDDPHGQGKANGHAAAESPPGQHDAGAGAADPTPGGAITGSVKVDDVELDDLPANSPHQGCQFKVAVMHVSDVPLQLTFDGQPPTTRAEGDQTLFSTVIPAGANGSNVIDLTTALAGITPQPNQGFHVALSVAPVGAADHPAKHKVFWVQACPAPAVAPAIVSGSANPAAPVVVPTQVLGEQFTRPAATPQGELAFTGSPFSPALGVVLISAGFLLWIGVRRPGPVLLPVRVSRRRR